MALPTAYLTSTKNLEGIFNAIQSAKAPPSFTQRFLEDLGYKSNADRLIINVLKALGFLSADGTPQQRYFDFLDQSQSGRVLAEAIEDAYADLYQLDRNAHERPRAELVGRLKTLTRGQASDSVVGKMATTFTALAALADFGAKRPVADATRASDGAGPDETTASGAAPIALGGVPLGGLVYNVELHLPDSRDPAVYEALFRALKSHLLS